MRLELATERLILREMIPEDWRAFYDIHREPAVVRYLTQDVATEDSAREYVERAIASAREEPRLTFDLAITERGGNGELVGRCGLRRKDSEPRIGEIWYVLSPACVGRGYATEAARAMLRLAFAELALHRIYADVDPRNLRSIRVLERIGMRREAHFVQDVWIKGEWCDTMMLGILAHEYHRVAVHPRAGD